MSLDADDGANPSAARRRETPEADARASRMPEAPSGPRHPEKDQPGDPLSRRDLLARAAALGAAASLAREAAAAEQAEPRRPSRSPGERIRLGFIGCGNQGAHNLNAFLANEDVVVRALCDVDSRHLARAAARVRESQGRPAVEHKDFRRLLEMRDLDAVVISTPDHWHALPFLYACQAGLDVWCEKPLSHNIVEAQAMLQAARRHGTVVQVGTWQRSQPHMITAVNLVKSGALGKIQVCRAWWVGNGLKPIGRTQPTNPPPELDFDLWLGPAPRVPYHENRVHYNFRWFMDYAGGQMSNWGVHMADVVFWAMGVDAPISVSAAGGNYVMDDDRALPGGTPDTLVAVYRFPEFVLQWEHRFGNARGLDGGADAGLAFIGENGTLLLDRGGWRVVPEGRRMEPVAEKGSGGLQEHVRNFLDCIRTRMTPRSDIETMYRTTRNCHLGNLAYLLGRTVEWDAERETTPNREARRLLVYQREYRKPWSLPRTA